jgi:hypothetical protein
MRHEAADRFMGDTILICHLTCMDDPRRGSSIHVTKRFVVLHHTLDDHRPVFRGKTVFGVFWSCSPLATHSRRAGVSGFTVSEHLLHLERQFAGGSKEEIINW